MGGGQVRLVVVDMMIGWLSGGSGGGGNGGGLGSYRGVCEAVVVDEVATAQSAAGEAGKDVLYGAQHHLFGRVLDVEAVDLAAARRGAAVLVTADVSLDDMVHISVGSVRLPVGLATAHGRAAAPVLLHGTHVLARTWRGSCDLLGPRMACSRSREWGT